jgi:hypothetical protein
MSRIGSKTLSSRKSSRPRNQKTGFRCFCIIIFEARGCLPAGVPFVTVSALLTTNIRTGHSYVSALFHLHPSSLSTPINKSHLSTDAMPRPQALGVRCLPRGTPSHRKPTPPAMHSTLPQPISHHLVPQDWF